MVYCIIFLRKVSLTLEFRDSFDFYKLMTFIGNFIDTRNYRNYYCLVTIPLVLLFITHIVFIALSKISTMVGYDNVYLLHSHRELLTKHIKYNGKAIATSPTVRQISLSLFSLG